MTNGKTLRIILTGAIAAIMAVAPVAQAKQPAGADVHVCNQATYSSGGGLDADLTDSGNAAKYQTDLRAMKGRGAGLVQAASRSSALSLCAAPSDDDVVVYPGDAGDANS